MIPMLCQNRIRRVVYNYNQKTYIRSKRDITQPKNTHKEQEIYYGHGFLQVSRCGGWWNYRWSARVVAGRFWVATICAGRQWKSMQKLRG